MQAGKAAQSKKEHQRGQNIDLFQQNKGWYSVVSCLFNAKLGCTSAVNEHLKRRNPVVILEDDRRQLQAGRSFVKERRPSISPNFNFLGQLQHFQSTLRQKASGDGFKSQQLDNSLPSINIPNVKYQDSDNSGRSTEEMQLCRENFYQQRHSNPDANGNQQKLWTHNTNPQEIQTPFRVSSPTSCTPMKAAPKPTQLQLPAVSVSLSERRKSLSLSLTPLGICPPSMTCDGKQTKSLDLSRGVKTDSDAKTISRHVGETHKEQSPLQEKQNGSEVKEQGLLSPLSCTLNKLLDWGERMLLGGVFAHPVKMGQPALPYRC
ncbi:uncharacterized protein si:ch211-195b15.8 isoform X2 [Corythoichthys intestinalis]|uniref:uncharacterized protein si:ch211-195b15.8 isoform X2 n=1 Tax=Corythoichthys intestinalis TaxID=161448 RepID=UPI0025A4D297|nr:uncharacterized protein si:ch211-195b15.8 isoform X2 [Corythoichthys intestinalis]